MTTKPPFEPTEHPHRRYNPLQKTWVLCSPHRTKRPWQGQVEPPQISDLPKYDPKCYLCPGNTRAGGAKTEDYKETFIFENDFAAVKEDDFSFTDLPEPFEPFNEDIPASENPSTSLYQTSPARGKCYVICFHPRHDLTVAEMETEDVLRVVNAWTRLYKDVSAKYDWIKHIQIFENKGAMMGCSNPHPHGQAWCTSFVPSIPAKALDSMREFSTKPIANHDAPLLSNGKPSLLLSYAHTELHPSQSPRVVLTTPHFVSLIPFWAIWPYEILILPHSRHIPSLSHLTPQESLDLADILRRTTCRLDNLFECSFAYSLGVGQCPVGGGRDAENEEWSQLSIGIQPPLLRSSTVRKFLVGFELFAEAQRDVTPEQAAEKLRACSEVHYKHRLGAAADQQPTADQTK